MTRLVYRSPRFTTAHRVYIYPDCDNDDFVLPCLCVFVPELLGNVVGQSACSNFPIQVRIRFHLCPKGQTAVAQTVHAFRT